MTQSRLFVHGFSAMAEAAIFINPALHNRSVNVDVNEKEPEFEKWWRIGFVGVFASAESRSAVLYDYSSLDEAPIYDVGDAVPCPYEYERLLQPPTMLPIASKKW
jgi:hypothetical protein